MHVTQHSSGAAHLRFTRNGAETVLTRAFAKSPAKLITTRGRGATCWVYAATYGGGLLGGDDIHMRVEVTTEARALLTTQASTKVYRSRRRSRQSMNATVEAGALFAVVPDPLVCFADADFTQTQRYDLHETANLVVLDWMTSGRHASGERWGFSRYESRIDIRRNSQQIFFDGVVLDRNIDTVADRMARFNVLVTAVVTGPLLAAPAHELVEHLSLEPITRGRDLVASTAKLRDGGTLLRMAGTSVEDIGRALRSSLSFLSPLVGDDLWNRKW